MAAPVDAGRATYGLTTTSLTHNVTLPGGITAGDLLIMLLREAGGAASFTMTGWSPIIAAASPDGSTDQVAVYGRDADGSEGATITCTLDSSEKLCCLTWRITGAAPLASITPDFSTVAVGTGTSVDPTAVTVTGGPKDILALWLGSWEGEQTSPPATGPTNYSNWIGSNTGTAGAVSANCRCAGGSRQLTAVSSEDGPAVTISAADDSASWTMAIQAAAPAEPGPVWERRPGNRFLVKR